MLKFRLGYIRNNDKEFIAAITIAMFLSERIRQNPARLMQDTVSFFMAARVINLLEIIEIQHHHRDFMAHIGFIILSQSQPVPDPGKRIGHRNLLQHLVLMMQFFRQGIDLAKCPDLRLLQKADKEHISSYAKQGHKHFLQVFRRKLREAVVCREKEKRIAKHDGGRYNSSAKAKQRRAQNQTRDQDHVWIRHFEIIHNEDQCKHDPRSQRYLFRQADLHLHQCRFAKIFHHFATPCCLQAL